MKKLLLLFCLASIVKNVAAQDPHFSQFFASPLTLSPAFTGKFNGAFRVAGNYRNQWPEISNAYITTSGSADFHINRDHLPSNDLWGGGVSFCNDNSANGAVKYNYFSLSTAYHKGLDEEGYHQLGLGFQATYANMNINTSVLNFEDMLSSSGTFSRPTGETFNNATLSSKFIDVNAGILYSGSTNDRNTFYAGVSLYHINRPKQSFVGANYVLNPRATIHAGTYFPLGETSTLHLSGVQTFQGGASETVLGGAIQFTANPGEEKPTSVYVGSWLRLKDAIIPYVGLEFSDYRFGLSYDVNTSSLKTASQKQGGIEVSLIYIFVRDTDKPINCPKF